MKTLGVLSFRQKNPGKKKTTNQVTSDDPQAQDIAKSRLLMLEILVA